MAILLENKTTRDPLIQFLIKTALFFLIALGWICTVSANQFISKQEKEGSEINKPIGTVADDTLAEFTVNMRPFHVLPMEIRFIPHSDETENRYQWDFGDGKKSTRRSPVHGYKERGSFKVTLQITTPRGDQYSSTKKIRLNYPEPSNYVSIIYLIPKDRAYHDNWRKILTKWALLMQEWFKRQSSDGMTFQFNPHKPIVDTVRSDHDLRWFLPPKSKEKKNYYTLYKINKYIHTLNIPDIDSRPIKIFADIGNPSPRQDGAALKHIATTYLAALRSDEKRLPYPAWIGCTGHELGHALGLPHPTHKYLKGYIMGRCRAFPNVSIHPVNQQRMAESESFYNYDDFKYLVVKPK